MHGHGFTPGLMPLSKAIRSCLMTFTVIESFRLTQCTDNMCTDGGLDVVISWLGLQSLRHETLHRSDQHELIELSRLVANGS